MPEPPTYIHGHAPEVLSAHSRRTAVGDAAHLLPHLLPTSAVLDVGCGPGTISADLAALVPLGSVTCLEISETALSCARQTCAARGVSNVAFATGDVTTRLPFPDGVFDVVHAHMVVIHLPDPLSAMREMRRVLKPGGLLACKDMIMSTSVWHPPDERLVRMWRVGIAGTINETGADAEMGARLKAVALQAGFGSSLECRASCWTFADAEGVGFWGASWAARFAEGTELRRKVVRGGYATEDEADGVVVACKEWMAEPGAWFGCMNGELLAWK